MANFVNGQFVPYLGSCNGADTDYTVWYNQNKNMYLYHKNDQWNIYYTCGSPSAGDAWGSAGLYPFLLTGSTWTCNAWPVVAKPASITCDLYGCPSDTFENPTQTECESCPPHLPFSLAGATNATACFTTHANIYITSILTDRIVSFDGRSSYVTLTEGSGDNKLLAIDLAFIDETTFAFTNPTDDQVKVMKIDGTMMPPFADVEEPSGLLYLPDKRLLGVSSRLKQSIAFFSLDDYNPNDYTASPLVAVVNALSMTNFPNSNQEDQTNENNVLGEPLKMAKHTDEDMYLLLTSNRKVVRWCVPNTFCFLEENKAVLGFGQGQHSELTDIALLAHSNSFLVADRGLYITKVYACPLDVPLSVTQAGGKNIAMCSVFAFEPEGVSWDPYSVLVDAKIGLVYVGDYSYSKVHAFTLEGVYMGRVGTKLGDLVGPSSMAIKEGPFAPLSSVAFEKDEVAAGAAIVATVTLKDRMNVKIASEYPIEDELSRFRVKATGVVPNTDYSVEVSGRVTLSSEGDLVAGLVIDYAGNWSVDVAEGGQPLRESPFEIRVMPAATDAKDCETTVGKVIGAGEDIMVSVVAFDRFRNRRTPGEDVFECEVEGGETFTLNGDGKGGTLMTTAGSYTLHVRHLDDDGNREPVAHSPFSFQVNPGEPDVKQCAVLVSDSAVGGGNITVQVLPEDAWGNTAAVSSGFSVVIDDGGGELVEQELAASSNYFWRFLVPIAATGGTIEISVLFEGGALPGFPRAMAVEDGNVVVIGESVSETDVYVIMASVFSGGFVVVMIYLYLKRDPDEQHFLTKAREIRKSWTSIAINGTDPFSDLMNWWLVMRKCGWKGKVYLVLVVLSFFAAFVTLSTSFKQLWKLSSESENLDFGNEEFDREYKQLCELYKEEKKKRRRGQKDSVVEPGKALETYNFAKSVEKRIQDSFGGVGEREPDSERIKSVASDLQAVGLSGELGGDEEVTAEMVQVKEKALLRRLKKIRNFKTVKFQKQRKKERVVVAMVQIMVEDIPVTLCNLVYLVFGCSRGSTGQMGSCAAEVGAQAEASRAFFLGTTGFTIVFATRKWNDYKGIGELNANLENLNEVMYLRTKEAEAIYQDLKLDRLILEEEKPGGKLEGGRGNRKTYAKLKKDKEAAMGALKIGGLGGGN